MTNYSEEVDNNRKDILLKKEKPREIVNQIQKFIDKSNISFFKLDKLIGACNIEIVGYKEDKVTEAIRIKLGDVGLVSCPMEFEGAIFSIYSYEDDSKIHDKYDLHIEEWVLEIKKEKCKEKNVKYIITTEIVDFSIISSQDN